MHEYKLNIDSHVGSFTHQHTKTLIKECALIHELDHPNVTSLVGICLDAGPSPYIILPFMETVVSFHMSRATKPFFALTLTQMKKQLVSMHYIKLI